MSLHSVYERDGEWPLAVADRFRWSAALFPPVFAVVHGVWAMLGIWCVGLVAIVAASVWIGGEAAVWLYALLAIWLGFSASQFTTGALARRGWRLGGEIIAPDPDQALANWLSRK